MEKSKEDKIDNACDVLLIGYEEEENLGLRSIAAFLTKHGIRTNIKPYDGSSKENILASIQIYKPKIVGFSLIFQGMLFEFADLISYLRQNEISSHFTIGGHFPTLEYKGTLELISGIDSVVRHEGEITLMELYHNLDKSDSWFQIKGLAYRKNGKIIVTPPRPLIRDINSLPFPVRNACVVTHRGLGICSISASRGCYYDCSFCSIHNFYSEPLGMKRRSRSAFNVAQEMEGLFFKHGIRIFIFKDDDLYTKGNKQREWIEDFAGELKKRKIADKILWRISCRVDDIDTELMEKLKEVGLIYLYLGIESGNNQGLKTFNKHNSVDDIHKGLDILRQLKIPFEYGFMMFDPDSTISSIKENISFLREICKDGQAVVHFAKMFPYVGTAIAQRLKKEGRLKGTIALPDYSYDDARLDLLQLFYSKTFGSRLFDRDGLVNRLQWAKFDTIVLSKFFSDKYDTEYYIEALRNLICQNNDSVLETMSLAANFIDSRSEEKALDDWQFLEYLYNEEKAMESLIASSLDRLISDYDFSTRGTYGN